MSREQIQSQSRPGFPQYGEAQLPKVNAMRADKSQPDFMGIPILHDGDVMLCSPEKPASCYTCAFMLGETCALLGSEIVIAKVQSDGQEGEIIEYWPCCSMQTVGGADLDAANYIEPFKTPEELGLIWINAPEVGQESGGANCGGVNGGDDCDHYQVESGEKWDSESGFCRVLQHEVGAAQVCSAWRDDDILSWQDAQQLLKGSEDQRGKKQLAREIIGRDED